MVVLPLDWVAWPVKQYKANASIRVTFNFSL